MNGLKMEPNIKPDPDTMSSPGGFLDDDLYEDTGELQMPTAPPSSMWLTRIPRWLWDSLATFSDDEEIEIGKLAFFTDTQGRADKAKPMKMVLNEQWQAQTHLPRSYELKMTSRPDCTYVFTEKDLPGYKPNAIGRIGGGGGMGGGSVQDPKAKVQKRSKYRKAIPKHTALVGAASREYACVPVENEELKSFMDKRILKAIQGENASTTIVGGSHTHYTNSDSAAKAFKGFIRAGNAPRRQENKAARIAKNELLDLLQMLFDEFEYWPMRALKQRTKQPEAYLKETLSEIADLVKSGPFASCWKRHAEFNKAKATFHGKPPDTGDDEFPDDDEDEMEDVV